MILFLVKKYWFNVVIISVISLTYLYIIGLKRELSSLNKDNSVLQSKLNESNAYLHVQNSTILANQADYNASIEKLPTVLHKIDTKYVTKTIEIEKWRDNNASQNDCNDSISYINNYKF
jgi:hypothetical protein